MPPRTCNCAYSDHTDLSLSHIASTKLISSTLLHLPDQLERHHRSYSTGGARTLVGRTENRSASSGRGRRTALIYAAPATFSKPVLVQRPPGQGIEPQDTANPLKRKEPVPHFTDQLLWAEPFPVTTSQRRGTATPQ